jgi:TyrR family helix-turn-helix protein
MNNYRNWNKAELNRLWDQFGSTRDIANHLGVSQSAVQAAMRRYGISTGRNLRNIKLGRFQKADCNNVKRRYFRYRDVNGDGGIKERPYSDLLFEGKTGLTFPDDFVIHHINKDRSDDSEENLAFVYRGVHTSGHKQSPEFSEIPGDLLFKLSDLTKNDGKFSITEGGIKPLDGYEPYDQELIDDLRVRSQQWLNQRRQNGNKKK